MSRTLVNILLILFFLLCYLEWGHDGSAFIAEVEWQVFTSGKDLVSNLLHPVILPCLVGQLLLFYSAVVKRPKKWLNILGVILIGSVVLLFLLIAILTTNLRTIVSVVPFLITAVVFFFNLKNYKVPGTNW